MKSIIQRRSFPTAWMLVGTLLSGTLFSLAAANQRAAAQEAAETDTPRLRERVGSEFLPANAFFAALLNPAEALSSKSLRWYPTEMADAFFLEKVGVNLSQVESARLVVAQPGVNDAMFAAVFRFTEPVKIAQLSKPLVGARVAVDGFQCNAMRNPPGVVLHQLADDCIVISSASYLKQVVEAEGEAANGVLSKLADTTQHRGVVTVVLAIEPIRPMLVAATQGLAGQLPPPLNEYTKVPDLLEAARIRLDLEDRDEGFQIELLARDADAAETLERLITDGLAMTREMGIAQMTAQIREEGPVGEAMKQYVRRVAKEMVAMITPVRDGASLEITAPIDFGMTTQAILMSMLMPAVRSSGIAAGNAHASNNLKQIGLAMHNYHSAYKKLPDHAIRDDQGAALLSWRVKVLPFIEQQGLYERFRLNEPWDSEHNLSLLDEMPEVYQHPNVETKPGFTVIQTPLHEETLFLKDGERKFRDVLDGLSNTVMVVETKADEAVPWTKPDDWDVDLDSPFAGLQIGDDGRFNVLFSDGAVLRLRRGIGKQTMKALLTIKGGEVIPDDLVGR